MVVEVAVAVEVEEGELFFVAYRLVCLSLSSLRRVEMLCLFFL